MRLPPGLLAALAVAACASEPAPPSEQARAQAIAAQQERIAHERALWPGYEPLAIPLAIYTGESTWLFRHPAPPEGFTPVPGGKPPAHRYVGRYPAVTSNTSAEIGGTVTATLMADGDKAKQSATAMAAVALHEAFHVYQRAHHKRWQGNEGDLLLYPAEDARLLALRRLESEALRRALAAAAPAAAAAANPAAAACWTKVALRRRRERFAAMDSTFARYERATELNEGLAAYIQEIAAGHTTIEIPPAEYAPGEVRWRAYTVGPALAFLLDRFRPGWQMQLEADDQQYLDEMLSSALAAEGAEGAEGTLPAAAAGSTVADSMAADACAFTPAEAAQIEGAAERDAAAVVAGRAQRRAWFDALEGWRVVIAAADGAPLWPQGFDPLNTEPVDGGLLHTRFCSLGNDGGKLEAIDGQGADLAALTQGLGPHPLFNGVRRAVIAGLAKPQVDVQGRGVTLRAPGFNAAFSNATVRTSDKAILVQLESAR